MTGSKVLELGREFLLSWHQIMSILGLHHQSSFLVKLTIDVITDLHKTLIAFHWHLPNHQSFILTTSSTSLDRSSSNSAFSF